jgi:diguanylate cyclase (GGDEF)-like protein
MALAILLCLGGFALALASIERRIDAEAAARSVDRMALGLDALGRSLSAVTLDYTQWTEAHDHLARGDLDWFYENFAATAVAGQLFDGLVLAGGPLPAPLAWQEGVGPEPRPSFLPPATLDRALVGVARLPRGQAASFDLRLTLDGGLVLLSAARVQPSDTGLATALRPADLAVAVITNRLGPSELAALGAAQSLADLRWGADPVPGLAHLAVRGPQDELLGHLSWTPPRPGTEILRTMRPVFAGAALAFVALGAVPIALAARHARRLVREEARARALARTDALTGLPNRLAFGEHLEGLARCAPSEAGVLFIDLNGFKSINDSFGHEVGDRVIVAVAERLRRLAGSGAFLARIGGDEFVFVLSAERDLAAAAQQLGRDISALEREPVAAGETFVPVSLALGLALRRAPGPALSDLVREADLAMYRAKTEACARRLAAEAAAPLALPYSPERRALRRGGMAG